MNKFRGRHKKPAPETWFYCKSFLTKFVKYAKIHFRMGLTAPIAGKVLKIPV